MEERFVISVIVVGNYEESLDSTVVPITCKTFEEAVEALKEEAFETFKDTGNAYTMEEIEEICKKGNLEENHRIFLDNFATCTYCMAINQIYI